MIELKLVSNCLVNQPVIRPQDALCALEETLSFCYLAFFRMLQPTLTLPPERPPCVFGAHLCSIQDLLTAGQRQSEFQLGMGP
jgi:hypothetical protein